MESAPTMTAPMAAAVKVSEEDMMKFLENGIAAMKLEETRALLKEVPKPGEKLIEIQRAQWDSLGVDRDAGCSQLDKAEKLFPGNVPMIQLRNEFVLTAQRTFLRSLDDKRPSTLETQKPMPREVIVEFFDACNTRMGLPETRDRLFKHLRDTKEIPNQIIIDIQRDQLEVLGFERDHGCAMLSKIGEHFPEDKELHQRAQLWMRTAQMTCMQVVKAHQMSGGEMPEQSFGLDPDLKEKAKKAVEGMSMEERKAHLSSYQKKAEAYLNQHEDDKASQLKKLSEDEKLELAKTEVVMKEMMKAHWHHEQQQQKSHAHDHPHDHQHMGAAAAAGAAAKPQQQQMM